MKMKMTQAAGVAALASLLSGCAVPVTRTTDAYDTPEPAVAVGEVSTARCAVST